MLQKTLFSEDTAVAKPRSDNVPSSVLSSVPSCEGITLRRGARCRCVNTRLAFQGIPRGRQWPDRDGERGFAHLEVAGRARFGRAEAAGAGQRGAGGTHPLPRHPRGPVGTGVSRRCRAEPSQPVGSGCPRAGAHPPRRCLFPGRLSEGCASRSCLRRSRRERGDVPWVTFRDHVLTADPGFCGLLTAVRRV